MSISSDLIEHAVSLLSASHNPIQEDVNLRRAVSAAYYALYHQLTVGTAMLIAPNVSSMTQHRVGRWFEHAEMKKVCGRFSKPKLDQPLRELLGDSASSALQDVASSFIKLQEARHAADYDLGYAFSLDEAIGFVRLSIGAMQLWDTIRQSSEANIFALSLLMWKNWERER